LAIKDIPVEECYIPGSAACPGCPATMAMRTVFKALGKKMIMVVPACCTAVIESLHPNTSFNIPTMNIAFEAAAAGASGVEAALRKQGKDDITVVAWAGDGGTYDIGIQALSGALERNTNFIYICYNNQIYSNTGIQRSGATPYAAWTTTTVGGKTEYRKEMGEIIQAHLSAASEKYMHLAPSKVMFYEMRNWGKEVGAKIFHLGGGVGAKRDNLFNFKRGLGTHEHEFETIQIIHDIDAYESLKNRWLQFQLNYNLIGKNLK